MSYRQTLRNLLAPPPLPDPVAFAAGGGLVADPWQETVLRSEAPRVILMCSRQSGKSSIVGALAMYTAVHRPNSLILIGAPSQNQSAELLLKAKSVYTLAAPAVIADESGLEQYNLHNAVLRMRLANRSRIICVPGRDGTVRAYSAVKLLIVDEAAYVEESFFQSVFPMLATSKGRMILLSTPHAKAGTFHDIWTTAPEYDPAIPAEEQPSAWLKVKITWEQCPRITPAFVQEYAQRWGQAAMRREFECEFVDAVWQVFSSEDIAGTVEEGQETWSDLWS